MHARIHPSIHPDIKSACLWFCVYEVVEQAKLMDGAIGQDSGAPCAGIEREAEMIYILTWEVFKWCYTYEKLTELYT